MSRAATTPTSPSNPGRRWRHLVFAAGLAAAGACALKTDDDTAPAPPEPGPAVTVTADAMSATSVRVGWSIAGEPSSDQFTDVIRNGAMLASTRAFGLVDVGLAPEATYCYRVVHAECMTFLDRRCTYSASADVCVTTPPDTTAPSAPAAPVAIVRSSSRIDLSWTNATDDVGVAGYRVRRDGVLVGTTLEAAFTDAQLAPATSFCYCVSAYDGKGNESAPGGETCASTLSDREVLAAATDAPCERATMAMAAGGALHVAYLVRTGDTTYELRHATDAAGSWTRETLSPTYGVPSIAIDAGGGVHVAQRGRHFWKPAGAAAWSSSTYDPAAELPSVATDAAGHVHVAYATETTVGGYPVRHLRHASDASGTWATEAVATTFGLVAPALGLDDAGAAHVFYTDGWAPYVLHHARVSGGSWMDTAPASGLAWDACAMQPSLAVGAAGAFHVAVVDRYVTDPSVETYEPLASCPAVALDSAGGPRIAYLVTDPALAGPALRIATRGGSGWSPRTVATVPYPADHLSLAVDAAGNEHVVLCTSGDVVVVRP